jgi:hypothetical protein
LSSSSPQQVISSKSKSVWRNTSIDLLPEGHPSGDQLIISGNFIAVGVFKHHSGMIPSAQPSDGFAYAVIIPDQSFASFAALASKVTPNHHYLSYHYHHHYHHHHHHHHHFFAPPQPPSPPQLVSHECSQVPLQQHLSDDRLLFLRCSRVTITPDSQNPIGYNVDGQSIPPVTLQITAGVERVDFVTNPSPVAAK